MPTATDIATKYPFLVIDPSPLLKDSGTPRSMEDLAQRRNSLWRQFFISWVTSGWDTRFTKAEISERLAYLNDFNKRSKDPKVKEKYEAYNDTFSTAIWDKFREVMHEIKQAMRDGVSGLDIAGKAVDQKIDEYANGVTEDKLAQWSIQLSSLKSILPPMIDATLKGARTFIDGMGGPDHKYQGFYETGENAIAQSLAGLQSAEARLREALTNYQRYALPYINHTADQPAMKLLARSNETLTKIYRSVDEGTLDAFLGKDVAEYAQASLALGISLGDMSAQMVAAAKRNASDQQHANFGAAFPEAQGGLLAAKTAVGAIGIGLQFWQPIGPAIAAGLDLVMRGIEFATTEILIAQATNKPDQVMKFLGKEYKSEDEESVLDKVLEHSEKPLPWAERAMKVLELTHASSDVGVKLAEMTEASRALAEGVLKYASKSLTGVGAVLTVASLAKEWAEYSTQQKLELKNAYGLTDEDVAALNDGLKNHWQSQTSNMKWDLSTCQYLGQSADPPGYKASFGGIEGVIRRSDFRFVEADRTKAHAAIIQAAQRNTDSITVGGKKLFINWPTVRVVSEKDGSEPAGGLMIQGKAINFKRELDFTAFVSVEGELGRQLVAKPEPEEELNQFAPQLFPTLTASDGATFRMPWEYAKVTGVRDNGWFFTCEVECNKSDGSNELYKVTIDYPVGGTPKIKSYRRVGQGGYLFQDQGGPRVTRTSNAELAKAVAQLKAARKR